MEFEDQEEQEEEMGLAPTYDSLANHLQPKYQVLNGFNNSSGSVAEEAKVPLMLSNAQLVTATPPQFTPYFRPPNGYLHVAGQQRPLALPSISGGGGGHSREDQEDVSNQVSSRKRFRTKFTPEQKGRWRRWLRG
ncbi:serine/threonine-protein kinase-like protein [Hibiscus syriacus]|uniref:Serine/threonine-protein kinase-like protein n=1 Tax=Hibiscus syriacus TaxID=106335 RepID=A0A6A3C227_HIBSY|nr:serine/threonine-protein kinase-like protein [Hibiscus syriacus]